MVEAVATSAAVTSMATAYTVEASTNEAPPSSWAATWAATGPRATTDTPTTMDLVMDMATGTESLRVTMGALSSASM
jgi:hypothetical protein